MKNHLLLPLFFFTVLAGSATAHTGKTSNNNDKIIELSRSELRDMSRILDYMVDIFKSPSGRNIEKMNQKRSQMLESFKENHQYSWANTYFHLIRFLEQVTTPRSPNPERACAELQLAVEAYDALEGLGRYGAAQAKKIYDESLGIDEQFLQAFYDTDYAKRKGFIYRGGCPCTALEEAGEIHYEGGVSAGDSIRIGIIEGILPDALSYKTIQSKWQMKSLNGHWVDIPETDVASYTPGTLNATTSFRRADRYTCEQGWHYSNVIKIRVEPQAPIGGEEPKPVRKKQIDTLQLPVGTIIMTDEGAVYQGDDGIVKEADNVIQLLRELVNFGTFNNNYFEIRELVEGDNRWIPGQKGVPYELTFKHNETFSTILFPVGEYIINDFDPSSYWDPYRKSMNMISTCIIRILDQFGNSAFIIMTQGQADAPTFTPKPLVTGYDNAMFSDITLLSCREDQVLTHKHVNIGTHYTNDELPDLRAAFLSNAILKRDFMRNRKEKVIMLKGRVTEKTDPNDRNASIVIWIDWDKADGAYQKNYPVVAGGNGPGDTDVVRD